MMHGRKNIKGQKCSFFCDVTQIRMVVIYQRFGTRFGPIFKGSRSSRILFRLLDSRRSGRKLVPKCR